MKYVALLRGVNVGGNKKVEMAKLKAAFESLKHENVSTYINSGNVIFETAEKDTKKITSEIEKILEKTFGFEIRTIIRDIKNIQKICKEIPAEWQNDDKQKTDILFLWDKFDNKKTLDLITKNPSVDTLKYVDGAIVWNFSKKNYTKSGMHKFIGTEVYKHMTARNVNTVRKFGKLMKDVTEATH